MSLYANVPSGYDIRPDNTGGGGESWWDKYVVNPLQTVFTDPITDVFTPLRDQGASYGGRASQTSYDLYDPVSGSAGRSLGLDPDAGWRNYSTPLSTQPSAVVQGASPSQGAQMPNEYEQALKAMLAGGGGGGGGGGGNAAAPLVQMRKRIDAEYGALIGRLDEMYQLAETDEERAMIEFALADLDDQYETAVASIGMVYDEAQQVTDEYAGSARERAAGVGEQVQGQYDAGVERALEQEAMARALLGEQFGQAYSGATTSGAMSALQTDLTNMQSDREGNYRQEMADLSAEDAEWVAANLGSQRAANTAEAGRLQATLRNRAVQEHQRQVQARINAERLARAQAEQSLIQAQMAAMASLAGQEASIRQSDINSRRSASASSYNSKLAALARLAEQKNAGAGPQVTLPNLRLGSVPSTLNENELVNNLAIMRNAVMQDPAGYFDYRGALVDQLTKGLEYDQRNRTVDYLYDLTEGWNVYDMAQSGSGAGGGAAHTYQ